MERKNIWATYNEEQLLELETVAQKYKNCLDLGKTERECVRLTVRMAQEKGYCDMKEVMRQRRKLSAGDKVYFAYNERAIVLFQVGEEPVEEGMNIVGAHIDSPRVDVKPNPLYEEEGLIYLDTHYYGGIKKYQWLALPLALHGVVVKQDGTKIDINIGEKENEPAFVITDILPHLGRLQREKKAENFIDGEQMDLLVGNRPAEEGGEKDEKISLGKKRLLALLKERYDVDEEDFLSAELEIVPAGKARDCGFDSSMILAYGQDDRVCAFTSLFAMLDTEKTQRTTCCILVDKEEIGSVGAGGMTSRFFENAVAELVMLTTENYNDILLRRTLANSKMLSSDVSPAYDAMYSEVFEKKNTAFLGCGPVFNKYTGSGGKSGTNDANPEYVAKLRQIMQEAGVHYQTGEIGRVDIGGGGTIAYLLAAYGMEVIDSGVGVLSMHAPWETTSKADVYEAVRCYGAFLKAGF